MKPFILLTAILALSMAAASAGDAKTLYEKECAKCHGLDGKGNTKMGKRMGAKDYTDSKVQADLKDDDAFKATKDGLKSKDSRELMKPANGISDDDIKALIVYMRTFKQ
jgi:cytochrome c5